MAHNYFKSDIMVIIVILRNVKLDYSAAVSANLNLSDLFMNCQNHSITFYYTVRMSNSITMDICDPEIYRNNINILKNQPHNIKLS